MPSILIGSSSFIAGNEDMHKILDLDEFEFWHDLIKNCEVTCP